VMLQQIYVTHDKYAVCTRILPFIAIYAPGNRENPAIVSV
jgi:hypothetical protein